MYDMIIHYEYRRIIKFLKTGTKPDTTGNVTIFSRSYNNR